MGVVGVAHPGSNDFLYAVLCSVFIPCVAALNPSGVIAVFMVGETGFTGFVTGSFVGLFVTKDAHGIFVGCVTQGSVDAGVTGVVVTPHTVCTLGVGVTKGVGFISCCTHTGIVLGLYNPLLPTAFHHDISTLHVS